MKSNDHDVLIEVRTEVKGVRDDLKSMTDDTKARLILIESTKLDKEDFKMHLKEDSDSHKDHEKRIRSLERYYWIGIGVVVALQFIAPVMVRYFVH